MAHAFEWGKLLKCHLKGKTCRKWANGLKVGNSEKKLDPGVGLPPPRGNILVQYSQRDVYILRAHARKKKRLSSTQNPRKTLAHSSQNPRLFHAMSMFIPRKKRVSGARYQSHACSRFPRSLRKRSVERITRHTGKGLSFRLVQKG